MIVEKHVALSSYGVSKWLKKLIPFLFGSVIAISKVNSKAMLNK